MHTHKCKMLNMHPNILQAEGSYVNEHFTSSRTLWQPATYIYCICDTLLHITTCHNIKKKSRH